MNSKNLLDQAPKTDAEIDAILHALHEPLRISETTADHRIEERKELIRYLLPKNGVGAEIGVFSGLFSRELARITQPKKLYLVDAWHLKHGERFAWCGPYGADGAIETNAALEAAKARTLFMGDKVETVISFSLDWLNAIPNDFLDWAYLDTSHKYEDTKAELLSLSRKITSAGVIMCDDCVVNRASPRHGVFLAVTEFVKTSPFEIVFMDKSQVVLRRSPA